MAHAEQPPSHVSPTRVRYLVVALTTLAAVLLYLDRVSISIAERYIKEDLGLSDTQTGFMFGAFFLTYALAQVPSGFLGDRFGARWMMTLYILFWSLFAGLTGVAFAFVILLAMRLGLGLAQAGAYPTAGGLLSKWVPFAARGSASSVVSLGGRVGWTIAPPLTAALIVAFVPVSVSSLLTPSDLLNPAGLCAELAQPQRYPGSVASSAGILASPSANSPLQAASTLLAHVSSERGQRLFARLPEPAGGVVMDVALRHSEGAASDAKQAEVLADGLNLLLRQRDFAEVVDVEPAKLPRQGQRLLKRPRSELSEEELGRLNRLVLETAYPQEIKKIYVAGWRPVMVIYGLIGIVVAALFWFGFRDRPQLHPSCNEAEVRLIESGRPRETLSPHGTARRVPLKQLCKSGSMWLMCVAALGTNIGWVFLITLLPRYQSEVHRVPLEDIACMQSIPSIVGWVGMIAGGWWTDRLARRIGIRWGRALPLALSRFLAMGAYLACLFGLGPWAATLAFCVVAFGTDLGNPSIWAYMQDVGGRYVGSVLGWANMWGNLGAAASAPLLVWVVGKDQWHLAFLTCAAAFLVAGICSLGVNATIPIAPPEEQ